MFLHLSVCPQRGLPQCTLGFPLPEQAPPRADPPATPRSRDPPEQSPPSNSHPPEQAPPTEQAPPYWNAFLFLLEMIAFLAVQLSPRITGRNAHTTIKPSLPDIHKRSAGGQGEVAVQ